MPQALSGFTGRKGCVGGDGPQGLPSGISLTLKLPAQPEIWVRNGIALRMREAYGTHGVGVKSVDIMGNTEGESNKLAYF